MKKIISTLLLLVLLVSCDRAREYAVHVKRFQAPTYNNKTYGTGFNMKVGNRFFIITNKHVCQVSDRLGHPKYAIVNGNKHYIAKISEKYDLCALFTDAVDGFELAEKDVEPLDKITLIGHPRGLDMVIREGRVVSEDVDVVIGNGDGTASYMKADQISATAYGGSSGSPVINEFGKVCGVLFAGSDAYPHEPLTVPYEFLKEFVESL